MDARVISQMFLLVTVFVLLALFQRCEAQMSLNDAMRRNPPPHTHLKHYGYHLLGDVDDYREEIKELAKYTNFISFSTHELWSKPREGLSRGLAGLSPEERKQAFASAGEKIRFAKGLGLDVVIANVGGPLMTREDTREPWFESASTGWAQRRPGKAQARPVSPGDS